jgi:D,D-heptose 1,7-bisphosphate phosphatase
VTPLQPVDQAIILVDDRAVSASLEDAGGMPFLVRILHGAARSGVSDLLLLPVGEAQDALAAFDGGTFGEARCRVGPSPASLGSAGVLRHAAAELADRFYVLNGGRFFDIDLNALAFQPPACLGMLALRRADGDHGAGRVFVEAGPDFMAVIGLAGPESPGEASEWSDTGVCALSREALALAEDSQSLERDLLPALAKAGRLRAVGGTGYFIDMTQPGGPERARAELPEALRRPAVFFDRDGVLNHDLGYTYRPEDLRLIDGAAETIRRCNRSGRYVFVVTNQSGVARGLYTIEAVRAFHAAMQRQLRRAGAHIDGLYICPHHPEGTVDAYRRECECRKPGPGMLRQAIAEWPVDVEASVMIGDRPSDMAAAAACGIRGFQFGGGNLERFCEENSVI